MKCTVNASVCKDGLLLPLWNPQDNLSLSDKTFRASLYMLGLMYAFLGVSIISDKFMTAIEAITSKEKEVEVYLPNGMKTVIRVKIWNDTVANLTLMALGSSAPEILLSIIEICGNAFMAGELGPSTIVGSAAYNLFIITAYCVYVVPTGESRTIKQLHVFFVTTTWSIFAYIWLYIILLVTSAGVVEIWEAVLTFTFFPGTILTAYIVDRELLSCKPQPVYTIENITNAESELTEIRTISKTDVLTDTIDSSSIVRQEHIHAISILEKRRASATQIMRDLQEKYPFVELTTLAELSASKIIEIDPKSKAFYRSHRKQLAKTQAVSLMKLKAASSTVSNLDRGRLCTTVVYFLSDKYTVLESVGEYKMTVIREGGDMSLTCLVDYETNDGTAAEGKCYHSTRGTIIFPPNQNQAELEVTIIDDDEYSGDLYFFVNLSQPWLTDNDTIELRDETDIKLIFPSIATVMIIDNDHPGVFNFSQRESTVEESVGEIMISVCRSTGGKGRIGLPYHSIDGTARHLDSFETLGDVLIFDDQECLQRICIQINNKKLYKRRDTFDVVLDQPVILYDTEKVEEVLAEKSALTFSMANETKVSQPFLGGCIIHTVTITECSLFKKAVDLMSNSYEPDKQIITWREQFDEAISVLPADSVDKEDLTLPTACDYIMHFMALAWKILVALLPPTHYFSGWGCFSGSIVMIGLLTAIIGDLASGFGCTIGFKDAFTAITFVALGTSLPDTFASKVAAVNERTADSAIGNVTGSNAVNVFLGLGIAWTIAAVYHSMRGAPFRVPPGDLATSVAAFCFLSLIAVAILLARRNKSVGGELGGPSTLRIITACCLITLWLLYIVISALVMYCIIPAI